MRTKGRAPITLIVTAILLSVFLAPISQSSNDGREEVMGFPAGWSDDINLSNSPLMQDLNCVIATNGNEVHVVWEHRWDTDRNIVYSKSFDEGITWGPMITLYHTELIGTDPDISVSGDNVHVVWEDWDVSFGIYYRNSTDGGESWNPTKRISPLGIDAYGPHIYANDSNVHIIWYDVRDGDDGEIYYRRSTDGGITFDNGQGVDEDRRVTFSPATIGGIQMAGDGSNISVVWYDERDGDFEVYWMISKDNGFTWENGLGTPNVGRKISDSSFWSVEQSIAVEGTNIHIVWYDEIWPGPVYEIYYCNSTNNGLTWNPSITLTGPNLASFAPNVVVSGVNVWVSWNDNRDGSHEIFFTNSTDGGISWGPDIRLTEVDGNLSGAPKVVLNDIYVHVVWWDIDQSNFREVFYKRYPDFPADTSPPTITQNRFWWTRDEDPINITVQVNDTTAVSEVWLNYTDVLGSNYNVTMDPWDADMVMVSGLGSGYYVQKAQYSYEIPIQGACGFLNYSIWAEDVYGNGILLDEGGNPFWIAVGLPEGWSDTINLSNDITKQDLYPVIAVNGDTVHLVWTYDSRKVKYLKSEDGGKTWGQISIIYNAIVGCSNPDIAVSGQNIHVTWSELDGWDAIYFRNSNDGGETWNPIKRITPLGTDAAGSKLYVNDSNVHIFWGDKRDGNEGEIYYRRSLDGGITFDNGQGLDEDRRLTFSPSWIGNIRFSGSGSNISFIWSDERNGNFDIYWMISKDNGFSWEDGLGNIDQGRRLTFDSDDSMWNSIAMEDTNIHIVWVVESWSSGAEYRLYYINSTDLGFTWNPIQLLSGPTNMMASPDIAVSNNIVHAVWDDRRPGVRMEIYYKNSTDGGITWGDDLRLSYNGSSENYWPRIVIQNEERHVIWFERNEPDTDREIMYKRYPDFPSDELNISLVEGWNLVSLPLEQSDTSLDSVLSSIDGKWDCVQVYDALDPDHWKSYSPLKPSVLNDQINLDRTLGFWIKVNQSDVNLTVSGYIPTSTSIPLYAGWNLVGYPSLTEMKVSDALWGTGADKIEVFDSASPYQIKNVGPNYMMKPGEGYWVRVPVDTIWTVDW